MPDRQRLTQTLIDLIRIDSPTGEEDAIDAHLSNLLANLGAAVRHDSYGNLVATLPGSNGASDQRPVMLSAHMDTVDPGRGINPTLDSDGETLRSDGTTILGGDCKAGIAIVMEGLTSAVEAGTPRRPVQVVFSRAEEGGLNGARNLDFSLVHAETGIVFDGEGPVSRICVGAPAQNIVQANITGVASHAGLEPENGVSALLVAANILTRLPWAGSTRNHQQHWLARRRSQAQHHPRARLPGRRVALPQPGQARQLHRRVPARVQPGRSHVPKGRHRSQHLEPISRLQRAPGSSCVVADSRCVSDAGLAPTTETTGGGSDANVFFEHGIAALPVGIGVRDFHTTRETANLSEIFDGARVCQAFVAAG